MRTRTGTLCLLMLALSSSPACLRAQQPDTASQNPAIVARAFFRAVAEAHWNEAAGYLDLVDFESYRQSHVAEARLTRVPPLVTAEQLMRMDSQMPRVVAEYQARRFNEDRSSSNDVLSYQFADIPTGDSLAALTTVEAAARWLEAHDVRYKLRRSIEVARARGQCSLPESVESMIPPQQPRIVLGTVVRDTVAYVLNSAPANDVGHLPLDVMRNRPWMASPPSVLELRRRGVEWHIIGSDDMFGNRDMSIGLISCQRVPQH